MRITDDIIARIADIIQDHSAAETAAIIGCSVATVFKVVRDNNIKRDPDGKTSMRSRIRKEFVHAERRRAMFGLDQKSNVKVITNNERNVLKYKLKRKFYIFIKRGDNNAYYDDKTVRDPRYEETGRKLGMRFHPYETAII